MTIFSDNKDENIYWVTLVYPIPYVNQVFWEFPNRNPIIQDIELEALRFDFLHCLKPDRRTLIRNIEKEYKDGMCEISAKVSVYSE